jgi:methyl-accepting chemotaxis protein
MTLAFLGVAAGLGLAWGGGWPALAGIVVAAGAAAWGVLKGRPGRQSSPSDAAHDASQQEPSAAAAPAPSPAGGKQPSAGGTRLSPMISEVVPIWSRQLDGTRTTAETGLNDVLGAFSNMSSALDKLFQGLDGISTQAEPGAAERAVSLSSAPLAALLAPSTRAFAQRDHVLGELEAVGAALDQLVHLGRQTREIGRHTRLVAFNASIESSRGSVREGGTEAVAHEMRLLATRMGECGTATMELASSLRGRLASARRDAVTQQTHEDELRMELDLRAREALQALMQALGASLSTSGDVREASAALRQHLDDAFVNFQFGDRVSQMLSIITNDMNNMVDWMAHHPEATIDDATEWLKRLEASYTMDEQRSEHHGNVHVDRGSEVEFF